LAGNTIVIVWTEYLRYRAKLRKFDLAKVEEVVRHSTERYLDTATGRFVVVDRHENMLVMIPYETDVDSMIPITIHATTRQQIRFRLKTGRLTYV